MKRRRYERQQQSSRRKSTFALTSRTIRTLITLTKLFRYRPAPNNGESIIRSTTSIRSTNQNEVNFSVRKTRASNSSAFAFIHRARQIRQRTIGPKLAIGWKSGIVTWATRKRLSAFGILPILIAEIAATYYLPA